ncbi:MAG: mechanosensitive ion channel family protein [Motiliproteus sp.]
MRFLIGSFLPIQRLACHSGRGALLAMLLAMMLVTLPLVSGSAAALPLVSGLAASEPATVTEVPGEQPLALMSDSEARAKLAQMLAAQEAQSVAADKSMLSSVDRNSGRFKQQLDNLKAALRDPDHGVAELTEQVFKGAGGVLPFLGYLLLMLGGGYAVERLLGYRLHSVSQGASQQHSDSWWSKLCFNLIRIMMDVVRIGIFFIAAILIPVITFPGGHPTRLALLALVSTITLIRIGITLSRALFGPHARGIRPLPMDCPTAGRVHRRVSVFIVIYFCMTHLVLLLDRLGYPDVLHHALLAVSGAGLNLMIIAMLLLNRAAIGGLFVSNTAEPRNPLVTLFSQTWPILVISWLMMLWAIWAFHLFVGNMALAAKVSMSWWITLLFPVADRLFFGLITQLIKLPLLQSRNFHQRSPRLVSVLMGGFRLILVCLALIAVSEAWGMGSMAMFESAPGQRFLSIAVDILVITLVAYIAWELIFSLIERHLPEPVSQESDSLEGEGGAGGASRTETLLPLLRSCLMALLVVTVVLSVLHALGIQIGPLLASAGVIGIAIGFGSQRLVQDIISGIFFLWDDAFRRGEYIETGALKGTVEQISIRSMQLRHHLGAVQTVPYGSIETVKNLSRDWVTVKLEMRLPYDTDIEKVRKIIKKIGQKMLEDEEMGPNMLMPLKSQGVSRIEESALIVRMKFTAKPGEQWVIRREAYRLVRDALQEAGISFAHPEVRVRMPEGVEAGSVAEQQIQQAVAGRVHVRKGAAAAADPKAADQR